VAAPEILRYTAFSSDPAGGNPAGVVLDAGRLDDADMQRIAAEVDFAETAFVTATREDGAHRVRYFSPIAEVPFCGHATIATAVALAERNDAGAIVFDTPVGDIRIEIERGARGIRAAFTSAPTSVRTLDLDDRDAILLLLGLSADDLDPTLPPRLADAGNPHPVIVLSDRARFDAFTFDPDRVRALMDARGWPATITIAHRRAEDRFTVRNLFPVGRITEDPATGSAAAALGAYLRECGAVPVPAHIAIEQGMHVGRPGLLEVDIPPTGRVRVSGVAVPMEDKARQRAIGAS
jgi:PhzF family phenazine biosynthesis protein